MTEKKKLNKGDLTLYMITRPLRLAMEAVGVNEDSMMKVFSDIVFDESVKAADRLRAFDMFTKLLGHTAGDNINLNLNTKLADVVEGLEAKLRQRGPGRPRKKLDEELVI